MPGRPWSRRPDNRGTRWPRFSQVTPMTNPPSPSAPARIAPAGLMFLAITSVGWGFNWPVTKYLLERAAGR